MKKSSRKKWIIIGIAAAAVALVIITLFIFLLFKGVNYFFSKETVSDQYLEQMLDMAQAGDAEGMRALYVESQSKTQETGREIDQLMDIWHNAGEYTYKKKNLSVNSNSFNGRKIKTVSCTYTITTDRGEKLTATLNRVEASNGEHGLNGFYITQSKELIPQGALRTIAQWNLLQWGLFFLSLAAFAFTIVTAAVCFHQKPRYCWAWIALILLAYVATGFSITAQGSEMGFRLHWAAGLPGLSRCLIYSGQGVRFTLCFPAGAAVYWMIRKRLD